MFGASICMTPLFWGASYLIEIRYYMFYICRIHVGIKHFNNTLEYMVLYLGSMSVTLKTIMLKK